MRRWGKAGIRLTEEQARQRDAASANRAVVRRIRTAQELDVAYELWRAGEFRPHIATLHLNYRGLYGPEVDEACGAQEPDVDLWEAGKKYPTWKQLLGLAELVQVQPRWLLQGDEPIPWQDTSMRFHYPPDPDEAPPVRRCDPAAVRLVVAHAPEKRPDHG